MRSRAVITIFLCIMLLLTATVTSIGQEQRSDAWKKFEAKHAAPGLQLVWDKQAGVPRMITGMIVAPPKGLERPVKKTDFLNIALAFLEKNRELVQIAPVAVKLKDIAEFQNKRYVTLKTYYKGIPIYRGQVGFTLDEQGSILSYSSDYNPKMEFKVEPAISKKEALEISHRHHKPKLDLPVTPKEAYLMIYQERSLEGSTAYRLVWYIFLATEAAHPEVDRVFLVDAQTGEVFRDFYPHPNAIAGIIQGEIYPEHSTDPVTVDSFEHEEVSVPGTSTNTGATGSYILDAGPGNYTLTAELEGPFVQVQSYDAPTATDQDIVHTTNVSDPGTHNFVWTPANCAPDDGDGLNVFWHANRLHDDYYQALGINWNRQMRYSVNRGNINNAFAGDPITIYSDAIARNCDVTYHETTHNVLFDIFGGTYIGYWDAGSPFNEGYAFDEGFADYVACSFLDDPAFGELGAGAGSLRDCDNTMQYPGTGYNMDGHIGGQLISGVAWDLWNREGLDHTAADLLLFAGLYAMKVKPSPYYFSDPNHSNYLDSLLEADDDNNNVSDGTPHDREIFEAFRNHDLLPVDVFCKDHPQDSGNVPSYFYFIYPKYPKILPSSPDIWVRNNKDGMTTHQLPTFGNNYIYVRVRNLGYLTATKTLVKVYWALLANIPQPINWHFIGESMVDEIPADSGKIAEPIKWIVKEDLKELIKQGTRPPSFCLLVRLLSLQDMMTEEGSVRYENNIAARLIW